jgi:hypothetical protein
MNPVRLDFEIKQQSRRAKVRANVSEGEESEGL